MGQSYRIRTQLGINKTINVQLDQEFEQLEILSLKIQQEDVYNRNCADYGVLVGRITANNGFGLPNARVSIFIPIDSVDESNPIISSIYPYKSPSDKNEDGYRYNLLPATCASVANPILIKSCGVNENSPISDKSTSMTTVW